MAQFTLTQHVEAPPERVFAAASDLPHLPELMRGITRIEMLTDGPVRVGTRFRETRVFLRKEASEVMEVLAFDPPTGYTLGCESHACRYRTDYRFVPKGDGTDVELSFEVVPLNAVAKVMAFLSKPMLKACMKETAKDLEDLAAAVAVVA